MERRRRDLFRAGRPLDAEPWVDLPDGRALAAWGKRDKIHYNQILRQTEKHRFFALTFDYLDENGIVGDYYEFGCHRARTFRMALTEASRHQLDDMRFLAFDSFEGLPEVGEDPKHELWSKAGALATTPEEFLDLIRQHDIYPDRVELVPGFYDRSLTPELQGRFLRNGVSAALICVDCDLYESAVPVFNFVGPMLREGSVIYLDDLFAGYGGSPFAGVGRAFLEFQDKTDWMFVRHMDIGWWGRSYIAVRRSSKSFSGAL